MRILYLHQYFRTPRMPGGTRSFEIGRRLVEKGHEVRMVTAPPVTHSLPRRTNEAGIDVTWLPIQYSNQFSYHKRIASFLKFLALATLEGEKWKPDVVFATSTPLTIGIPGILTARRWGVPMVFEVRDLWPDIPIAMGAIRSSLAISLARKLEHACYREAQHIIALSPGMRDGILRSGKVEPGDVTVIPNLCSDSFTQPDTGLANKFRLSIGLPEHKKIVLYAGTLGRVNNIPFIVDLAEKMADVDPNVFFLIAGDGSEKEANLEAARTRGLLGRNLFFINRVPKDEVAALFYLADLTLSTVAPIPELFDNSANKFFDSLAAGRPIAINHGGWQAEMIEDRGLGLVLPSSTREAAQMISGFLDDAQAVMRAQEAARVSAASFSADRAASMVDDILARARQEFLGAPRKV